ncbi:MAG: aminotransferase class V-fold PLP-dependent enzyme [Myxococcales bacterium]|nr:aminotransferase class V-fold PLP-dependent enzyme [Myxococcales bacterium]
MSSLRPSIYLDHHASAPLTPAVRAAIGTLLGAGAANPSSIHGAGQDARHAIDRARVVIARAVGAKPRQVVLTSGATEANHAAIRGCVVTAARPVAWSSALAHPSVHAAIAALPNWEAQSLPITPTGHIDLAAARQLLDTTDARVDLLSVTLVSNELGTIQRVSELVGQVRASHPKALIHCDASQALGRVDVDFGSLGVDLLTLSGHKIGAPAGIGALIIADGLVLRPVLPGHQEGERRGGTENLIGAVALGTACGELPWRRAQMQHVRKLRDALWAGISELEVETVRHADVGQDQETGTCLSVAFVGLSASDLVMSLDVEGVAVSAGSACSSGTLSASPVIAAIVGEDDSGLAASTLRFSLGPESTTQDVDGAIAATALVTTRLAQQQRR